MNTYLVDMRCPRCNHPVRGREDVTITEKIHFNTLKCKQCKSAVKLAEEATGDTPNTHYFKEAS